MTRTMTKGRKTSKRSHVLGYKFLYTVLVMAIYTVCRQIPLYGVRMDTGPTDITVGRLVQSVVSGDMGGHSIMALGIMPFIFSTVIVQIFVQFMSKERRSRISPSNQNSATVILTIVIAAFMSINRLSGLSFTATDERHLLVVKTVAMVEMLAGALLIVTMSGRAKKYGIGGQTAIFVVNVVENLFITIYKQPVKDVIHALPVVAIVLVAMVIMENAEFRIPLLRISIHNVYADKNYLAIKLNPIGMMPVMLSSMFFALPQFIFSTLASIFPQNERLAWIDANMTMDTLLGVWVYIGLIFLLNMLFSLITIGPSKIADRFLESGDCIEGIHAGTDTKRYLVTVIVIIGTLSSIVMSMFLGIPMLLQAYGVDIGSVGIMMSSTMILTGLSCTLYREIEALHGFDSYRAFI